MGLDMYLIAKKYLWDYEELESKIKEAVGCPFSDKVDQVKYRVKYWRKANAIHNWFVQNIQEGKDDCGTYDVSVEQLTSLRDLCAKVISTAKEVPGRVKNGEVSIDGGPFTPIYEDGNIIANTDEIASLMPTTRGCFFGSTEYDEHYMSDIKKTKEVLDKVLSSDLDGWYFEYSSSW